MTEKEIHTICDKYRIKNYAINNDMSIDVVDNILLQRENLNEIPINFNIVYGDFICSDNNLKSLKGCPKYVSKNFDCHNNQLEILKHSPEYVGYSYNCGLNNLKSLNHTPKKVSDLYCNDNQLKSFEYCPDIKYNLEIEHNNIKTFNFFPNVGHNIVFYDNSINELWVLFKSRDYIDYFNELDIIQQDGEVVILDRLNYFLTDIGKKEVKKDDIKKYIVK